MAVCLLSLFRRYYAEEIDQLEDVQGVVLVDSEGRVRSKTLHLITGERC